MNRASRLCLYWTSLTCLLSITIRRCFTTCLMWHSPHKHLSVSSDSRQDWFVSFMCLSVLRHPSASLDSQQYQFLSHVSVCLSDCLKAPVCVIGLTTRPVSLWYVCLSVCLKAPVCIMGLTTRSVFLSCVCLSISLSVPVCLSGNVSQSFCCFQSFYIIGLPPVLPFGL